MGIHPYSWSTFREIGVGGPAGVSITAMYVFPLKDYPWKREKNE